MPGTKFQTENCNIKRNNKFKLPPSLHGVGIIEKCLLILQESGENKNPLAVASPIIRALFERLQQQQQQQQELQKRGPGRPRRQTTQQQQQEHRVRRRSPVKTQICKHCYLVYMRLPALEMHLQTNSCLTALQSPTVCVIELFGRAPKSVTPPILNQF